MSSYPITDYLYFYQLEVVPVGILPIPMMLVDLEDVQPSGLEVEKQNVVKEILSSKVRFAGTDIVLPKLRPYLGKALPNPPQEAIGSSEWVGVKCCDADPVAMAVFLNSTAMCETMRLLQSGKQHPRVSIGELNSLRLDKDISSIDLNQLYADLDSARSYIREIDITSNRLFDVIRSSCDGVEHRLGDFFEQQKLGIVSKGMIGGERHLVDLDAVKSVNHIDWKCVQTTHEIGSDKVDIANVDIIFSKLEPYLGKITSVIPDRAIGSTEWVGLSCRYGLSKIVGSYALALPELCSAYRKLQSGKRHARINVEEMLELSIPYNLSAVDLREIELLDRRMNSIRASIRLMDRKLKEFSWYF
mgnify:CR=1 FL=1